MMRLVVLMLSLGSATAHGKCYFGACGCDLEAPWCTTESTLNSPWCTASEENCGKCGGAWCENSHYNYDEGVGWCVSELDETPPSLSMEYDYTLETCINACVDDFSSYSFEIHNVEYWCDEDCGGECNCYCQTSCDFCMADVGMSSTAILSSGDFSYPQSCGEPGISLGSYSYGETACLDDCNCCEDLLGGTCGEECSMELKWDLAMAACSMDDFPKACIIDQCACPYDFNPATPDWCDNGSGIVSSEWCSKSESNCNKCGGELCPYDSAAFLSGVRRNLQDGETKSISHSRKMAEFKARMAEAKSDGKGTELNSAHKKAQLKQKYKDMFKAKKLE